ncbi:MAG: serine protease [Woeseiaceae bacterium]
MVKIYTESAGVAGLPRSLDGVPVVIQVTGKLYALHHRSWHGGGGGGDGGGGGGGCNTTTDRWRPACIGISTGHPSITAGTIGARVVDGAGNVYALSNNHVYADENRAAIYNNVLQPGPFDGGTDPADAIGTLVDFEPLKFDGSDNTIDAAIALSSTTNLNNATPPDGYGVPKSTTVAATINQRVKKYGRTTGQTKARVSGIHATVDVCYEPIGPFCSPFAIARFVNQIIISPGGFSAGGDSGSLIVVDKGADARKPVGLLFAGSSSVTIANPIDLVLNRFGVSIDGE